MKNKTTSIILQSNCSSITDNLKFYNVEDTIEYLANLGFNYMYLLKKFDENSSRIELKTFTDKILVLFFKEIITDLFEEFGYTEEDKIYYIDMKKLIGEIDYNSNLIYLMSDKNEVFRMNLDKNTLTMSSISADNRVRITNYIPKMNIYKLKSNYLSNEYKFGTFIRKDVEKNDK